MSEIIEITSYYPKEGKEAEVLAHRLNGCRLREAMGLPAGEVMALQGGEGAAVRWICRYADQSAFEADLAARTEDPDFAQQRAHMGTLISRFERSVYKTV